MMMMMMKKKKKKKKKKEEENRSGVDRMSGLPDAIIHLIFSFLDMKLMVQASILSNRWRYLWKSTPFLNFHLLPGNANNNQNQNHSRGFIDFVDRVLYLRETSCNIQTFNLCCKQDLKPGRICTWLILALRLNVQHISLDLDSGQSVDLPCNLFTSDSLKLLKLRLWGSGLFQLPNLSSSNNTLTTLELESVELPPHQDSIFTSNFPLLIKLVIARCFTRPTTLLPIFTISAPLLETLVLIRMFGDATTTTTTTSAPIHLNLRTPNLKSLFYIGPVYGDFSFHNLSHLVTAEIYMLEPSLPHKQLFLQYITSLFRGIYNVKKLAIPNSLVKTIAGSPYMLELLPNLLHSLRYVELVDWTTTCIQTITSFLERFSHIETLVWSRSSKDKLLSLAEKGEDWIEGLPVYCKFHSLKTVEIRNSHGMEDELKFLEFLLERAIVLKGIFITTSTQEKSKKFSEKLLKLPRSSSDVLIHFRSGVES